MDGHPVHHKKDKNIQIFLRLSRYRTAVAPGTTLCPKA